MAVKLTEKQIKDGWQIVKFGEIAKEVKKTTKTPLEDGLEFYIGLEHLDPQSLRITRKGIIAEDNPSFTRRFTAGQILFGKRRAYQKKAAITDFDGICSGDIIVIEEIPGKIISGLLPFIVQSDAFFDWAVQTSSGSLSPRTKWKSLAEFEFPLPPIERQKEILEVLEKVEEAEQKTFELIHSSEKLFKSLNVNQVNQNYPEIDLGKVCTFLKGKNLAKKDIVLNGSTSCILYGELFTIYSEKIETIKSATNKTKSLVFSKENDVLMPTSDVTPTGLATASCIMQSGVALGGDVLIIRSIKPKTINGIYLSYFIKANKEKIMRIVSGTTVYHLYANDLKKLKVKLPSFERQCEIVDILNTAKENTDALKTHLTKYLNLKNLLFNDFLQCSENKDFYKTNFIRKKN